MPAANPDRTRRRVLLALPLAGAAVAGGVFLTMLNRMQTGDFDPRGVPNPRVGQLVPDFSLPAQPPATQGFSAADIRAFGRPILVNFFASWCVPCLDEAQTLLQLQGIPLWGIAYKDTVEAASGFLARNGNPFSRLARDEPGRVAIDWGVYGVPESYFIDRSGIVRWRWAGALTEDAGLPQLRRLMAKYK
jgi:cytochrome c biogenesis protein CcmG/thiol:disulfide interchange protein DsbE